MNSVLFGEVRNLGLPGRGHIHPCLLVWKSGSVSCAVLADSRNPMDCGPAGSSVHGILQARILDWGAIPFSQGSSWPRDLLHCRQILYHLIYQGGLHQKVGINGLIYPWMSPTQRFWDESRNQNPRTQKAGFYCNCPGRTLYCKFPRFVTVPPLDWSPSRISHQGALILWASPAKRKVHSDRLSEDLLGLWGRDHALGWAGLSCSLGMLRNIGEL